MTRSNEAGATGERRATNERRHRWVVGDPEGKLRQGERTAQDIRHGSRTTRNFGLPASAHTSYGPGVETAVLAGHPECGVRVSACPNDGPASRAATVTLPAAYEYVPTEKGPMVGGQATSLAANVPKVNITVQGAGRTRIPEQRRTGADSTVGVNVDSRLYTSVQNEAGDEKETYFDRINGEGIVGKHAAGVHRAVDHVVRNEAVEIDREVDPSDERKIWESNGRDGTGAIAQRAPNAVSIEHVDIGRHINVEFNATRDHDTDGDAVAEGGGALEAAAVAAVQTAARTDDANDGPIDGRVRPFAWCLWIAFAVVVLGSVAVAAGSISPTGDASEAFAEPESVAGVVLHFLRAECNPGRIDDGSGDKSIVSCIQPPRLQDQVRRERSHCVRGACMGASGEAPHASPALGIEEGVLHFEGKATYGSAAKKADIGSSAPVSPEGEERPTLRRQWRATSANNVANVAAANVAAANVAASVGDDPNGRLKNIGMYTRERVAFLKDGEGTHGRRRSRDRHQEEQGQQQRQQPNNGENDGRSLRSKLGRQVETMNGWRERHRVEAEEIFDGPWVY